MTDEDKAVMFGGFTPSGESSEAHVFHLPTMTWRLKEGDPWPRGRSYYVAACLGYGGQHQRVFITGGDGGDCVICGDIWLMDPQSGKKEEIEVSEENKKLTQRSGHSAAAVSINSDCMEVILYG